MDWQLFNVVMLGFAFMALFTAFVTTSMCSKLVTSSLKLETINFSEEFNHTFNARLNETDFFESFTEERNASIIESYRSFKSKNQILPDDQIVELEMKHEVVNEQYGRVL